ncbi:hypothetical protein M9Y10_028524 [Tritrichomonas musculus]|uniref:Dymeclin n=1 Tax=Tritrichomonas musculus TaxID=1915356 RepID=A0ABR2KKE5_9EUKA
MDGEYQFFKRQDPNSQQSTTKKDLLPDQWSSFLIRKIKSFQKTKDLQLFSLFKYWFIALENDPSVSFDFVYSTPLISILEFHLLHYQDFQKMDPLLNILQIISVLTSFNTPKTPFFSTPELLQIYLKLLSNENQDVVKFILIILSQLLFKEPELLSFYHSVNLSSMLLTDFLNSDNESISGVSVFFLFEIALFDQEKANHIFQTLFNLAINDSKKMHIKVVSTIFNSLLFFSSNSPQYLSAIISNNFCGLCNQMLALIPEMLAHITTSEINDKTILINKINDIAISIFSILLLIISNKDGLENFISLNIIGIVSEFNYINPTQNRELLLLVMNLFTKLITLCDININQQIISNDIIKKCCICASKSEHLPSMGAIEFISAILLSKNKDLCLNLEKNDGIQIIFDKFESFDEKMALIAIQSFLSFLSVCPDSKQTFLTLDLDKFADEIDKFHDDDITDQGYLLISSIQ